MSLILIFIIGLSVGSFLNVVIDRLPTGKSIIRGRSKCDYCQHTLSWYDLVPVLSFIWLKQRCRYCHKKISWQYPIVESITGIFFVFTYTSFSIYHLILISGLIAIFFTDLKYRIIPDQVLIILTMVTSIYLLLSGGPDIINHLATAVIFFCGFMALVVFTKGKGMGLGDVKYAAVSGFILGIPYVIVSFYLSFLTGAAVSLILIMIGKKTMKSTIPFGPFLVGGTVVSLFYGDVLWNIFRRIIGI